MPNILNRMMSFVFRVQRSSQIVMVLHWFYRCAVWDGQMVLAGGESGYLQIWDLINVQEVCRITAHEGTELCFS